MSKAAYTLWDLTGMVPMSDSGWDGADSALPRLDLAGMVPMTDFDWDGADARFGWDGANAVGTWHQTWDGT